MSELNSQTETFNNLYIKEPIGIVDDIPVFSESDFYINNYQVISEDHISAMKSEDDNPWIGENIWSEMEEATVELVKNCANTLLTKNNLESLKCLDVGVGIGRLLTKVKSSLDIKLDIELHGMDIAFPYLLKAKKRGINVIFSKIEDMPFPENYFDIITCTDVLEHVLDLNICVSKILSVLKPGGYLVVRVPNKEDLSPYLKIDYPYQMAHVRNFDIDGLKLLFTKIFENDFIDSRPSLFIENSALLKYKLPLAGYHTFLKSILRILQYLNYNFYKATLQKLYHSTEINIVIQKK